MKRPDTLFPLIRHFSALVTPFIIKMPVSPNHVTGISLLFGLFSALLFCIGEYITNLISCIIFFLSYLMDHCDGEVAREKKQISEFGHHFDSFSDWLVHAGLFVALGYGTYTKSGDYIWILLGIGASIGATINYIISLYIHKKKDPRKTITNLSNKTSFEADSPNNLKEKIVFIFRELARADFWLIVIIVVVLDITWLLVLTSAIGAQIYWITQIYSRDKIYRV